MLIYLGDSAITEHAKSKLLAASQGSILDLEATHFYMLHVKDSNNVSFDALKTFLPGLRVIPEGFVTSETVFVFPRPGTISPWSSKATNIANVCGFKDVLRIERGVVYKLKIKAGLDAAAIDRDVYAHLYDRMTHSLRATLPEETEVFDEHEPSPLVTVDLRGGSASASRETAVKVLNEANVKFGLALATDEINYLADSFLNEPALKGREPTDVELFMFGQVNSEHCRHKIFNADWTIDGKKMENSLFGMIRNTHKQHPEHTISAYSDNAAVFEGSEGSLFVPENGVWTTKKEIVDFLGKVETHNHPTAVSPFPGAATGSGGEIRDEGAVGQGSKPKAGMAGYSVSDLLIPGYQQPWEMNVGKPNHIASSLDIMLQAPIGSSSFNNEFGRPCINGYFRTLTLEIPSANGKSEIRGYHKPIMAAGGVGTIRKQYAFKRSIAPGSALIVLGGPALLVGLGGGAASSMASGEGSVELDFASVQRGNPEMQRRAQMVIDACTAMDDTIIQSIHDVGAGGLSNALPELVHDAGLGAHFELRDIPCIEPSMSPMQIWCCEAQERYVLAIKPEHVEQFAEIANRERCPFGVVGYATEEQRLLLTDRHFNTSPIDLPMDVLFGKPPKMSRVAETVKVPFVPFDATLASYLPNASESVRVNNAVERVLHVPAVASKSFLITIGDRSVTGLIARDQMVGPWQVPVSDVAVTVTSFGEGLKTGEAMAVGEKPITALISAAASARMAVAESLMNMSAAHIKALENVKLSANWMADPNYVGESSKLYEAVQAIGLDLCPKLGISIPVGKDSMSMRMTWKENGESRTVTAPLSLIITGFAPVSDVSKTWTPQLRRVSDVGPSKLVLVDLANGKQRLGGSILAQAYKQLGNDAPDLENAELFKNFCNALIDLHDEDLVLAYHDRSDGGLFVTLSEMAFAGRAGFNCVLDALPADNISTLFNEELGAVFQVSADKYDAFVDFMSKHGVSGCIYPIGDVSSNQTIVFARDGKPVFESTRAELQSAWAETSYQLQSLRDNPECARQEFENIKDDADPGIVFDLSFNVGQSPLTEKLLSSKPRVAILREQGVNGHMEMAYAFHASGFEAIDVHMSDIISGKIGLDSFVGIAACGGFSYGDVLGAGNGWATSVLLHESTRKQFYNFFSERKDTFALGVCNGCQFLTRIKELIPGVSSWPRFVTNESAQYEGRFVTIKVDDDEANPSVFLKGMNGSRMPIVVAHGEGRAEFDSAEQLRDLQSKKLDVLYYVDNNGQRTMRYPFNPNGSPASIAGVRSPCGRFLAMMPHPERVILRESNSYFPKNQAKEWGVYGPWIRLFQTVRTFSA
ncbi:phosphoribosylformylglycinamidine synthase Ade3 [Schizosaccharomyces japonicus yFS275]|uniref:Phosphoribosylformylglycinamidine synthase n=1 Tax=Schizosaccharomyces japonicus (strain yFS275 / FY16936) TaxID=402676 RepID=B6K408_SCHJY|nr:phosphoribosylformylglycinamidine synthase Ade3 [Schizosaccharomyces japonicus yFS275]EEB08215.2 phosphoribosylformylglycinamidine synthase Ade3 [Schizosaccharomyces japonicus yFS275]